MSKQPYPKPTRFRFRTRNGQWLSDEIIRIEAMATEQLQRGVVFHSVQTGALAWARVLLEELTGELVAVDPARLPACSPATKPARWPAPEGGQ